MRRGRYAALLAATIAAIAAWPAQASADPLAAYRGRRRVVVALGAASDPALAAQRRVFASMAAGARERDLVLVVASDGTALGARLRRRFGGGPRFRAVLVGKDGGGKLVSDVPLGPRRLFPAIDAMPMRREEMRRGA